MNEYIRLMEKSDACITKAVAYAKQNDWCMATFWKNASIGFKNRALNLKIEN